MNLIFMIICIVLSNLLSIYEAANNPSNMLIIMCINLVGMALLFTIYFTNIKIQAQNLMDFLDDSKNLKPLEKIFLAKGITKECAENFEKQFGDDGWLQKVDSPSDGDLYFAIAEYENNGKNMLGITAVLFNGKENTWCAIDKSTREFLALDNIICFKEFDTLPENLKDKLLEDIK
jgi:Fe-S-cluster formation regulator IscX/YfhJ